MEKNVNMLEFDKIIEQLQKQTLTETAKHRFTDLKPYMSESELQLALRDTSEARKLFDEVGTPPIPGMEEIQKFVISVEKGAMLLPEQLEALGTFLSSVKRLQDYLKRAENFHIGIAYKGNNLDSLKEIRMEIQKMIRGGVIDDYATSSLKEIRRNLTLLNEKIRTKAESLLKNHKEYYADSFIVNRNGHICLPVKKECKLKVGGSVIEKSATGATYFIEPTAVAMMRDKLQQLKFDEENEERIILYTLSGMVADQTNIFQTNMDIISDLDFVFAKGKFSATLHAVEPKINTDRKIEIKQGRHPLLDAQLCVPLDFEIGKDGTRGVVITGPNTGGKTVAIKTVGLLCLMAQCGLHIPCEQADICMNNQVLCDIGDGQNITQNLSTFSAHITNVLEILRKGNNQSLVILDELGSGTDPAEGMGIAIAILEELRESGCLFVVTTHYPEVKVYAEQKSGIQNAMMAFDRETLKPLYRMEIGKAGESCALYIASRLGMPDTMIRRACIEVYGEQSIVENVVGNMPENKLQKKIVPSIQKKKTAKATYSKHAHDFQVGDSVMVYPEEKIGIVVRKANLRGEIVVQLKKEKRIVNHKRIKLQVAADELYPDDYDFSIIFDTVANRKARHKMEKAYRPDIEARIEE